MRLFCRDIIDKTENNWVFEKIFNKSGDIFFSPEDDKFYYKESSSNKYFYDTSGVSGYDYTFPTCFIQSVTDAAFSSGTYKYSNGYTIGFSGSQFVDDIMSTSPIDAPYSISSIIYNDGKFIILCKYDDRKKTGTNSWSGSTKCKCFYTTDFSSFTECYSGNDIGGYYKTLIYVNGHYIMYNMDFYSYTEFHENGSIYITPTSGGASDSDSSGFNYSTDLVNWNFVSANRTINKFLYDNILGKYYLYTYKSSFSKSKKEFFECNDIFNSNRLELSNRICQFDKNYTINGIEKCNNELIAYGKYKNKPAIISSKDNGRSWTKPISFNGSTYGLIRCAFSTGREKNHIMLVNEKGYVAWKEI